ncbi:hypothetical protein T492DRAFT_232665 [Pavlovales sp. CCMP2436]|nr:hypothetical protein T492DRAFT_232665 [Pavlovales sp. CCMP2436]
MRSSPSRLVLLTRAAISYPWSIAGGAWVYTTWTRFHIFSRHNSCLNIRIYVGASTFCWPPHAIICATLVGLPRVVEGVGLPAKTRLSDRPIFKMISVFKYGPRRNQTKILIAPEKIFEYRKSF